MHRKLFACLAFSSILSTSPVLAQELPSYAQPEVTVERIAGRVDQYDGAFEMTVHDDRGFVDEVQLHQGTIIRPTGIRLASGMVVSIIGTNAGNYFAADEIDTPYVYYGGIPYYEGHPWTFYGTSLSLSIFFGSLGWWHGSYFAHEHYGWNGGYRVYTIPHYTGPGYRGDGQWRSGRPDWDRVHPANEVQRRSGFVNTSQQQVLHYGSRPNNARFLQSVPRPAAGRRTYEYHAPASLSQSHFGHSGFANGTHSAFHRSGHMMIGAQHPTSVEHAGGRHFEGGGDEHRRP